MIAKTVTKANLRDLFEIRQNLEFWMSKSPEDRIAAVERLRRERHGSSERLQRTARVIDAPCSKLQGIIDPQGCTI
jgi:hypothetical protein